MGWSYCGKNSTTGDEMGYGVAGVCAQHGCGKEIDHGLSYVCGSMHEGGDHGCGRYFCEGHLIICEVSEDVTQLCEECSKQVENEPEEG